MTLCSASPDLLERASSMRPYVILAAFFLDWATGSVISAQPDQRIRFNYRQQAAQADCPNEERLRDGVSARLGRNPFDSSASKTVSAEVEPDVRGLVAVILVADGDGSVIGERAIRSEFNDCSELAAAMEFAIAVAIDPFARARSLASRANAVRSVLDARKPVVRANGTKFRLA